MKNLKRLAAAAVSLSLLAAPAQAVSLVNDAEIEDTLEVMLAPILESAGIAPSTISLFLIQDRSLNAFVAGRNMAFHTGLLRDLETPEELYGVMAHETGHIAGGHFFRRQDAARKATGPTILGYILGVAAAVAGQGAAAGAIFSGSQSLSQNSFLTYSRSEESAADQAGVTYMERVGIDPRGMLVTLRRLADLESVSTRRSSYGRTHPLSRERISALERRVNASPHTGGISSDIRARHARMRAKLEGFLGTPTSVLSQYPASDTSTPGLIARTVALHRLPDPQAAIHTAEELVRRNPNDGFLYDLQAQILFESGEVQRALTAYRSAARLEPDEPLILASLGRALLSLETPAADAEARAALQAALREDRFISGAWRWLAQSQARLGDRLAAQLSTAEYNVLVGNIKEAERNATFVRDGSPTGSAAWLRADDILAAVERAKKDS